MAKHSHHNVRLDDITKETLRLGSIKDNLAQALIVRKLINSTYPEEHLEAKTKLRKK